MIRAMVLPFFAILAAEAQTPQFEVASIKLASDVHSTSRRGGPGSVDPGLFQCENYNVSGLIQEAYDLKSYQFREPEWMQALRFNISAKVPEGTTYEQFRFMLQNLLTERLKLTFHHEKKEMVSYDLLLTKNGPKFKESKPDASTEDAPVPSGPAKNDERGFPVLPPDHIPRMMVLWSGQSTERFEAMEGFVRMLSDRLNGPVNDVTGLKGTYEFTLRWIQDGGAPREDSAGPTLLQAIQEQLGLRVQKTKSMVDIFVVNHLEKTPTENE